MSTTPDPQRVREIAREHIRSGRTDIGTTVVRHFGDGVLSDEEFAGWEYDVHQAWQDELRAVSWPDEQPQDERDGEADGVMVYLLADGNDVLTRYERTQLRAVLAEREQLRAERDGATGPRCRALTNTRLNLQCDRPDGHDAAHVAELAGLGRISWHGDAPQQPERDTADGGAE